MQLAAMHRLAQDSVNNIIAMSSQFEVALNAYSERQLVHELGYMLRKKNMWVAFEQRYPAPGGKRKRWIADIMAYERSGQELYWVEVKSRGVTDDWRWDNPLSALGWEHDFKKLRGLDNRVWSSTHIGYWVWLFLFSTYRAEVVDSFGGGEAWSSRMSLRRMADAVGRRQGAAATLGRVLLKIGESSPTSTCSIVPELKDRTLGFSALLVTAQLK